MNVVCVSTRSRVWCDARQACRELIVVALAVSCTFTFGLCFGTATFAIGLC
jgi:hypothetical protein